jgi:multidrug transporter EmrE-like cation transporter
MRFVSFLILVAAGVTQAAGASILKYAMEYRKSASPNMTVFWLVALLALACFGAGFPLYASALSRMKLSVVQPIYSGMIFLLVTIASLFIFKETFSVIRVVGMVVIVVGMVLVAFQP